MKVGVRLPTLVSQGLPGGWPELTTWARRVEADGYDSVWCVDHLLAAEYVFGSASLEPLAAVALMAGATERVQVGTSVLVAPLRHQVWLAKELGTLSAVAGDRVLLGLGAGWDEREFAASGVDRGDRGPRLDTLLAALQTARQTGEFRIDGVPIDPAPSTWARVLVGGGSSATVRENGHVVRMNPRVAQRIARADGWFIRSSATADLWRADMADVQRERERLGIERPLEIYQSSFLHVSDAPDHEGAVGEQMQALRGIGWEGDPATFKHAHPHGTRDELLSWFEERARSGVHHLVVHPVGDLDEQLHQVSEVLLPGLSEITVSEAG